MDEIFRFRYGDPVVNGNSTLVFNSYMSKRLQGVLSATLALAIVGPALSDSMTYQQEFKREVVEFANLNRLQIERLNRDVHADCYVAVIIATTILGDGSVKDISVVKSSSVPIVDKYFRFVIEQSAPFQSLSNHYDPAPEEITVTQEFRLDVRLWSGGASSTRQCDELTPRSAQPD